MLKSSNQEQTEKFIDRLLTKNYLVKVKCMKYPCMTSEPKVGEKQTFINISHNGAYYRFGMPLLTPGIEGTSLVHEKEIFYEIFGRYSQSQIYVRVAIKLLLGFCLLFFLSAFVQHVWAGLQMVIDWIL